MNFIENDMKFKISRHSLNFYGQCIDEKNEYIIFLVLVLISFNFNLFKFKIYDYIFVFKFNYVKHFINVLLTIYILNINSILTNEIINIAN